MPPKPHVVVIGAGAAGILAAWRAATLGAQVTLLEKTNRIGTKILVSGGGKCNIAHAGQIEDVIKAFLPEEARFIRPACYKLRNDQIVELFTRKGLRVYTRPNGRIFPVDQTAKDVVSILRDYLREAAVDLRLESPVTGLILENGVAKGVRIGRSKSRPNPKAAAKTYQSSSAKNLFRELDAVTVADDQAEEALLADRVILCCGGNSYPNSGTTGDGWAWAKEAGHTIAKVRAALAPIYLSPGSIPFQDLSGIALQNIRLVARQPKEIASWIGDLLFTHQGISGPCALGISRTVAERMETAPVTLEVDLQPESTFEQLSAALHAWSQANPKRQLAAFLEDLIPARLIPLLLSNAGIPEAAIAARLDKKARNRLTTALKAFPLGPVRHIPLEKGEVVAGGIDLAEVDPQTMRSKKVENLYLCGEILDVAGPIGGYNLQAAFATGYVAGESAAT